MKLTIIATAAAFAFGFVGSAVAADAPGAKSDIVIVADHPTNVPGTSVEGNGKNENPGSLSAPENDAMGNKNPSDANSQSPDTSAANVPGTGVEGDNKNENQGSLSAPEADAMGNKNPSNGNAQTPDTSAANVPGTGVEGDNKNENQGSLSAPQADSKKM
jgi:hypothetical protein